MSLFTWLGMGKKSVARAKSEKQRQQDLRKKMRRQLLVERLDERVVLSVASALQAGNTSETVNTGFAASQLASALVGPGVTVSNATFTGNAAANGSFNFADPTVVGFGQGIVLSSGNAADVVGPNAADFTSTDFTAPGDTDLTKLAGYDTHDAAVLEFDFIPTSNQVVFNYSFASDEYPEWVNTPFNDVFAFYVNGADYATVRQVAGDPASPFVPVAVNNINNGNPLDPTFTPARPDLFRPNYADPNGGPSAINLEQDGITSVLTFQAPVNPGVVNHMKLAIADASDGIYDSAVFIQAGSLVSNQKPVADLSLSTSHGSAPLPVTAIIEGKDPNGLPLSYSIAWGDGTVSSGPIVGPNGESEDTMTADHIYSAGGSYTVTLTISNGTLSNTSTDDVEVTSAGQLAPAVTSNPTDKSVVDGELFTFAASASGSPIPDVQWQVSTDGGLTFVNIPLANQATYSATASLADSGNQYQAVFTNGEGTATTTTATLTVAAEDIAPAVTSDPTDQTVLENDLFTLTASATGSPTPSVQWQVSTDYGLTFANIPGATATSYTAQATLANQGNLYQAVFTNDEGTAVTNAAQLTIIPADVTPPVAPNVWLANDTGSSSSDHITSDGSLALSAIEDGAIVEYSIDNGANWTSSFKATEGPNDVLVRQTDAAGNAGAAAELSFMLDTVAPTVPGVALTSDTGSSASDNLTSAGGLTVSNVESGSVTEYSTDGGQTWSPSIAAAEGANTVELRQTDLAGNVGSSTSISFTLDTTVPAAPGVALTQDTGSSATDKITKVGTLAVSGTEADAKVEYSTDNGATWTGSFSAKEGLNTVSVRQTDAAGNVSAVTVFSFTLDTTPPQLHPAFSTTQPILVGAKGVTVSANAADASGIASQSWGTVDTATAGKKSVTCTATDLAGNTATVNAPYVVGYAVVNITPQSGATFKQMSTITVSFQLKDANGRISDQTAANMLANNVTVTFDSLSAGKLSYNTKTHTFSVTIKLGKLATGIHNVSIHVMRNGAEVTTVNVPVKVV